MLSRYTVFRVSGESGSALPSSIAALMGAQLHSTMLFVVREREPGGPPRTAAEASAVQKACMVRRRGGARGGGGGQRWVGAAALQVSQCAEPSLHWGGAGRGGRAEVG